MSRGEAKTGRSGLIDSQTCPGEAFYIVERTMKIALLALIAAAIVTTALVKADTDPLINRIIVQQSLQHQMQSQLNVQARQLQNQQNLSRADLQNQLVHENLQMQYLQLQQQLNLIRLQQQVKSMRRSAVPKHPHL
jgi:hypothetical protein